MKTWDPVLVKLARMSDPEWANTIRTRNRMLLESLNRLKPYVGMSIEDVTDDIVAEIEEDTEYGCPHCHGPNDYCDRCLWTKAGACGDSHTRLGSKMWDTVPCATVMFPSGCRLCDIWQLNPSVNYDMHDEGVRVHGIVNGSSLQKCIDFVQDHIDWADHEEWGKDWKGAEDAEGVHGDVTD